MLFERALDLLADDLRNSLFQPDEIEKERQVIFEELAMTEDNPGELVGLLIDEVVWPDQALGRDVGGTPATVGRLERAQMLEYLARQYVPPSDFAIGSTASVRSPERMRTSIPSCLSSRTVSTASGRRA